ncbi:uncharacterized protein [Rutidosis leptorrhynchoides]|uniref:uncharacterized protein n=1 Tax=Rutidosis leptorrhynchoides TaxID=125765 RepID=UPI003A99EE87
MAGMLGVLMSRGGVFGGRASNMGNNGMTYAKVLTPPNQAPNKTLRNNLLPRKIEICVWRALKKRLPVWIELDKRGIDLHSVRCPICDNDLESVDHTLFNCSFAIDIWNRVFKWWNFSNFSPSNGPDSLHGKSSHVMSSLGSKIWQAVAWVTLYYLWKNRNLKAFQHKGWCAPVLLNELQVKSFEWISSRIKGKNLEWTNWLTNPHMYLVC